MAAAIVFPHRHPHRTDQSIRPTVSLDDESEIYALRFCYQVRLLTTMDVAHQHRRSSQVSNTHATIRHWGTLANMSLVSAQLPLIAPTLGMFASN
jgi:hypothetical protein